MSDPQRQVPGRGHFDPESKAVAVSVVIPVYKRADWLALNLKALGRQNFSSSFEVVVVDDGSPNREDIARVVEKISQKGALTVALFRKTNAGPAAARNYGAKRARGRILCFLDDDSVPEGGWLEEIVKPFGAGMRVGLVSGKTRSYDRDSPLPVLLERTIYKGKCWATCNIAYQREAFNGVGGFDETFPEPSWEDNDLGLRVLWAGFLHHYAEKAVVFHPHERSIDEYRQKCLLNGRGMAVFAKKHWRDHPLWGIGGPLVMARRLIWGLHPSVLLGQVETPAYVRFTWSWYSLKGFCKVVFA